MLFVYLIGFRVSWPAVVVDDGMSPANRAFFEIMILVRSMQFGDILGDMTVPASYHGHVHDAVIGAHALG